MKRKLLSYGMVICATSLLISTVACGRTDSGGKAPSNMSSGMHNSMGNSSMSNSSMSNSTK